MDIFCQPDTDGGPITATPSARTDSTEHPTHRQPMSRTLSKSDFKLAQECPTKLYYRKRKFPSTMDENEYLQMLAEGGYAVGKLATLLFPDGVDLGDIGNPDEAVQRTNELLAQENVTVFEAAVRHSDYLVRVDVLVKCGEVLELIEVKSTTVDGSAPDFLNKAGTIETGWRPYIEDVAYQTMVARLAYPNMTVVPYLMMPDKSRTTTIEGLNSQFEVKAKPAQPGSHFRNYTVTFTGDVEALRADRLLAKMPMEAYVTPMLPTLANAAAEYASSLNPELTRLAPELSVKCGKCEYRNAKAEAALDGFRQCWGTLADAKPSLLDLYYGGSINRWQKDALNELIRNGKASITDIADEVLIGKDPDKPYLHGRPLKQKHETKETIAPDLRGEVNSWRYPLHFIDFETSTMALPYHKGMKPYEVVAFQWSCHTIRREGADPEHHEWINTLDAFPNFEFARSLMKAIGREGTALMWATHENTTLRAIRRQMDAYGEHDPELAAWLDEVVKFDKQDVGWFTDMDDMARKGYFHPRAGGRTSIKVTLPAVLQAYRSPRIPQWLQGFDPGVNLLGHDASGLINPYKLLPAIQFIDSEYGSGEEGDGDDYVVNEGTGAMRAYQDMFYGLAKDDPRKQELLRNALLTYCKLDTLAMVVIWEHWRTA